MLTRVLIRVTTEWSSGKAHDRQPNPNFLRFVGADRNFRYSPDKSAILFSRKAISEACFVKETAVRTAEMADCRV